MVTIYRQPAKSSDRCAEVLHRMAGSQLQPDRLSLEVTDLTRLVGRVCHSVENENPGVPIRLQTRGRSPYRVLIPSVAFSQGLMNLLDNAIQSSHGEAPVGRHPHRPPDAC